MSLKHLTSGKVRDIYELDADHLVFVASDRMSAFDVVMAEPIPDKGRVLTAITAFWLEQLGDVAPNHLVSVGPPPSAADQPGLAGRTMVVRKAEMLPIECIVRGYLSGSAWAEYERSGTMHGQELPAGLRQSEQLPEPVFTPSTKAASGHDENISFEAAIDLVGEDVAAEARRISLAAYAKAAGLARQRGIIIADTKFELGFIDGGLAICDEVLTPDSSRFWPEDRWAPGTTPPSFDKQPVRDWAQGTGWDKQPPPPAMPAGVVAATRERYIAAYEQLSGRAFADWPGTVGPMGTFNVLVEVRLREGIADPQGATIERALPTLGFDDVSGVSTGKAFRFSVEAADAGAAEERAGELCRRFLTNPVIEDAIVSVQAP